MTEIGAGTLCRPDDPPAKRHRTVGRPLPGYELRTSTGEVQVRGAYVTPGYHRRPDATAELFDGDWLRTGDLGEVDDDGYLSIDGRAKELVHVGGFNVFPAEVEGLLLTHPAVAAAAVIGTGSEHTGESLQAFVVAVPGERLEPAELRRFARARVAGYKVPYAIEVLEALPLLASGKPDRAALGAMHEGRTAGVA
jgi:fatty-acyl-CoA synthase